MFIPLHCAIDGSNVAFLYQHSTSVYAIAKCINYGGVIDWLIAAQAQVVPTPQDLENLLYDYNYVDYKLPEFPCRMVRNADRCITTRLVENKYEYYKALEDGFISTQELEESV